MDGGKTESFIGMPMCSCGNWDEFKGISCIKIPATNKKCKVTEEKPLDYVSVCSNTYLFVVILLTNLLSIK